MLRLMLALSDQMVSNMLAATQASVSRPASACTAKVLVYSGAGVSKRSLGSAVEALRTALTMTVWPKRAFCNNFAQQIFPLDSWKSICCFQVDTLTSEALVGGSWQRKCALLVMPGGADLPYCAELNGQGNQLIRSA